MERNDYGSGEATPQAHPSETSVPAPDDQAGTCRGALHAPGSESLLTVAIPTFERNEILTATLEKLLPQVGRCCRLLVLDNCSKIPVGDTIGPLLSRYPEVVATVVRNPANIGANANILRCMEVCTTPWLWILGDDDEVTDTAVTTILRTIAAHPNYVFFNFSAGLSARSEDRTTVGVDGFVDGIDDLATVLFVSTGVYRVESVRSNLRFGYHHTYSCAPHLASLIQTLGEAGLCLFSAQRIIERVALAEEAARWNPIAYYMGCMTILDLPALGESTRSTLASKVRNLVPGIHFISRYLVATANNPGARSLSRYQYAQICARTYFASSAKDRAVMAAYRLCLLFPALGHWLISTVRRATGRTDQLTLRDVGGDRL